MERLYRRRSRRLNATSTTGVADLYRRYSPLGTEGGQDELVYEGSIPCAETDGYEYCYDYNNRHNDSVHQSSKAKKGYFGGYDLEIQGLRAELTPVALDRMVSSGTSLYLNGTTSIDPVLSNISIPGHVLTDDDGVFHNPYWDYQDSTLGAYYLKARRLLRPDLPRFQGLREAAELKDIPGMLEQRFTKNLRGAANFNLAVSFGWLPLLSSVRSFIQLYLNLEKYLSQLLRDDGRAVRRRRELVSHKSTRTKWTRHYDMYSNPGFGDPHSILFHQDNEHSWTVDVETSYRIWAVGTFMYHLPDGIRNLAWMKKLANRLGGFRLTPSVVYDLIPWTWLIDWFSNVGDIVHSMDPGVGKDGAFSDFNLMGEKLTTVNVVCTIRCYHLDGSPVDIQLPYTVKYKHKLRRISGPFDFTGETDVDMSDFQKSILVSLGISKFSRVFRR